MPLLEWIGLVSFIFLLGAIIGIMPSLVALEAFHLTNIPLFGDIVVSAIVVAIVMAICPRVMIIVIPVAIMVVAISLVMLVPISTIVVVVVSSILMESRASMVTVVGSLVRGLLVFANMVLPLSIFRLLYLALQSYSLIKQRLKGRSVGNRQRDR
jgi:hypothetical protein